MRAGQSYQTIPLTISFMLACSAYVWPVKSYAQQSDATYDVQRSASRLAKRIEQNELAIKTTAETETTKSQRSSSGQISAKRMELFDLVFTNDTENVNLKFIEYMSLVEEKGSDRDKNVGKLYSDFLNHFSLGGNIKDYNAVIEDITPYFKNEDWFIAFQAYALKCTIEVITVQRVKGLESAQIALSLIPEDVDSYSREARIQITDAVILLHNLQYNVELSIENTERLIDLKMQAGQEVDGIELLNNLLYSVGVWRDHETSLIVAETLERLEEKYDSTTPG